MVLGERGFLRFWLGFTLSGLGDQFYLFTVVLWALKAQGSALAASGLLLFLGLWGLWGPRGRGG